MFQYIHENQGESPGKLFGKEEAFICDNLRWRNLKGYPENKMYKELFGKEEAFICDNLRWRNLKGYPENKMYKELFGKEEAFICDNLRWRNLKGYLENKMYKEMEYHYDLKTFSPKSKVLLDC